MRTCLLQAQHQIECLPAGDLSLEDQESLIEQLEQKLESELYVINSSVYIFTFLDLASWSYVTNFQPSLSLVIWVHRMMLRFVSEAPASMIIGTPSTSTTPQETTSPAQRMGVP